MKPLTRRMQLLVLSAGLVWLSSPAQSQDFTLDAFAIGAGGMSAGGDFELTGTVGQPDAGELLGGDFAVSGGFWSLVAALEIPGGPPLHVTVAGGQAIISWPEGGSTGLRLEETTALAGLPANTVWSPVNVTASSSNGLAVVALPIAPGNRFYRLHQP